MDESIGARLKEAREQRRLTLQQVSETTKVRPYYLEALENDDLSAISSAAQARGFLRIYADFLGLNVDDLLSINKPAESSQTSKPSTSPPSVSSGSVQDAVSENKTRGHGLLGSLLNRITRRTENPTPTPSITATSEAVTSLESPVAAQPEPFMPAHVTEELPAIPDPKANDILTGQDVTSNEHIPANEPASEVKKPKKTGSRPRKTSSNLDKPDNIKKKGKG